MQGLQALQVQTCDSVYICTSLVSVDYLVGFLEKRNMPGVKDALKFKKDLEEKKGDWKSKLSGAFSSEQIFFSLFVLAVFYAGYTGANVDGKFDVDTRRESDIIESCYCKSSHKHFYRAWFWICCTLWFILHSYTYVAVRFRSLENFLKLIKAVCLGVPKNLLKCPKYVIKCCCSKRKDNNNTTEGSTPNSHSDAGSNKNDDLIQHYIKVLWFQYYKLYVIGYTKGEDEKIILDQTSNNDSDDKTKNTNDKSDDKEMVTCLCFSAYVHKKVTEEQADDCTCGCDKELGVCFNILKNLYHGFLVLVKYLAQLLTMPLLFLQVFDTYSLLCFSPRSFCSNSSDYKLHLAQAAITLLFYCCLALSQLTITMLHYNPWPKKDDKSDKHSEDTRTDNSSNNPA